MKCEVECTDEFSSWYWGRLDRRERRDVGKAVDLLEEVGTDLGDPHSSEVKFSRHGRMRELRIQSGGQAIRVFYAFDPRRTAIVLLGGRKRGQERRFYRDHVRRADSIYDEYLRQLRREGLLDRDQRGREQ